MITDAAMYRRALGVLARLDARCKDGTATPEERERRQVVQDHVLVWEWAHDDAPAVDVIPLHPEPVEPQPPSPDGVAFASWWDENRFSRRWQDRSLSEAFAWWWAPRARPLTEDEEGAILDELEARGMIYTDPMQYFDARDDAA